ncbi:PqqD family protein [Kribbella sp. NPDC056345]|uniref:PqqD family protein n=1 Tax=Kribbella sp. NPDC056345 TaxID=3345789 RepID=UPI0035DE7087
MPDLRIPYGYHLPHYVAATITTEGAMLLDTRKKGTWFAVNPPGAHLLTELLDGATLDLAVQSIADHYCADRADVWIDMSKLTADLCDRGLLLQPALGRPTW